MGKTVSVPEIPVFCRRRGKRGGGKRKGKEKGAGPEPSMFFFPFEKSTKGEERRREKRGGKRGKKGEE